MHTVEDFIPHRDRMKLVNAIVEVDDTHCVTQSMVTAQWPLCTGDHIDSIVIVELVAQTISVYVGWKKREKTRTGGKGVIVGIKSAILSVPEIPVGKKLKTSCKELVNLDNQYGEFEGEVKDDHTTYGYVRIQTLSEDHLMSTRENDGP